MKFTPNLLKRLLNLYPPYLGAGVRITNIGEDWRELHVSMKLHWFNRNAVGTHFGGSLYSMADPHVMLLLIQLLGEDYWVWDKTAEIEFIKASKGKVSREKVNFICNCCGCCCEAMIAARRFAILNPVHTTNFIPENV